MGSGSSSSPKPNDVMPEPTAEDARQRRRRNQEFQEIEISNLVPEVSDVESSQPSHGHSGVLSQEGSDLERSQSSRRGCSVAALRNEGKNQLKEQYGSREYDEQFPISERTGDQVTRNGRPGPQRERKYQTPPDDQRSHDRQMPNHSRPEMGRYGGADLARFTGRNDAADEFYGGARSTRWNQAGQSTQQQQRVVHALRPQNRNHKTDNSLAMQLENMEDEDVIAFETFYHRNGRTYTCINQAGHRFYMDSFDTQEWQPIPNLWYSQGHFERDGAPSRDDSQTDPLGRQPPQQQSAVSYSHNHAQSTSFRDVEVSSEIGSRMDDRAGSIQHPTRGRILTYIFEEKRNIHCYFDDATGGWIKMPISWEQHTDFIKPLVQQVKETIPTWEDKYDVIAALRQSNYDIDDAVATYYTVGDTSVMESPDRLAGFNTKMIKEKDNKISILQTKLAETSRKHESIGNREQMLEAENQIMRAQINSLQEQVTSLEVEVKAASLKVASLQQERPPTTRPITRMKTRIEVPVPQGPVIDEETLKNAERQAKALDKAHRGLKNDIKNCFSDLNSLLSEACQAVSQMTSIGSSTSQELDDLKVLYKKECLQRKLLYNQVQELRGNIRVFCRVRFDDRTENCHRFPSDQDIMCNNVAGKKMSFRFDKVFTPDSKQTEVFAEVLPIITSCVDGYNICIMAYGQTGAGKTYTMMGQRDDPGVNVSSIRELLKVCNERTKISYTLKVSMVEVYNEHVQDLLSENSKEALDIRMQGKRLVIKGLTEFQVRDEGDITDVMEIGDMNRSVASTKMNSTSSRSHLLLMLTVEGVNKVSNATSFGSLTLVDLAGSERISKTEATGQRLVEAAAINKSLTSLGQVFSGLRSNALHVPYRNSKLTHLLQSSLGGDAKACLFVNVSPDEKNVSESISTLQFGANAKQVQLGKATQNIKGL